MANKVKKQALPMSRIDFPRVDSLANLEAGRIYTTSNPDLFTPLQFNRGVVMGFKPNKVKSILQIIDEGKFFMNVPHVLINMFGEVIDGNNRLEALRQRGMDINFIILNEKALNLTDSSEVLNNVSDLNSINPSWTDKDSFNSACDTKEPAAMAIIEINDYIAKTFGFTDDMFTPSRIIALATRFVGGLTSKKQPRRAYCNPVTAKTIRSDEFKKTIDFVSKVLLFVKGNNPSITEWQVITLLLPTIWRNELSMNVVLKNLMKVGFKEVSTTKKAGLRVRVKEIFEMGIN